MGGVLARARSRPRGSRPSAALAPAASLGALSLAEHASSPPKSHAVSALTGALPAADRRAPEVEAVRPARAPLPPPLYQPTAAAPLPVLSPPSFICGGYALPPATLVLPERMPAAGPGLGFTPIPPSVPRQTAPPGSASSRTHDADDRDPPGLDEGCLAALSMHSDRSSSSSVTRAAGHLPGAGTRAAVAAAAFGVPGAPLGFGAMRAGSAAEFARMEPALFRAPVFRPQVGRVAPRLRCGF
jgi:hypothetical protein